MKTPSIVAGLNDWKSINGRRDPRPYLDENWPGVQVYARRGYSIDEIVEWCRLNYPEDHVRMFDRIWFSNEDVQMHFFFTWK